jgi:hypothetical protein
LKQSFDIPRLANDVVLEPFPAKMHVREEVEQRSIIRQCAPSLHAIVIRLGWNRKVIIRELQRQHTLSWRVRREHETDRCLIACRLPVRRVVHLKDEIRPGRYELRHVFRPMIGRTSGRVYEKHVAVGPMRLVLQMRISEARGGEWSVLRSIA